MKVLRCAVLVASLFVSERAAAQKRPSVAPTEREIIEAGVFELSAVEKPPRIVNRAEAERAAVDAFGKELAPEGGSGSVTLRFRVGVDGMPSDVTLGDSVLDPRVVRAATRVAMIMRFTPALVNRRPVRVLIQIPLQYNVPPRKSEAEAPARN